MPVRQQNLPGHRDRSPLQTTCRENITLSLEGMVLAPDTKTRAASACSTAPRARWLFASQGRPSRDEFDWTSFHCQDDGVDDEDDDGDAVCLSVCP